MKWYLITAAAGVAMWAFFIKVRVRGACLRGAALKACTSALFLLTLFAAVAERGGSITFGLLLGGGLLFGLLGDIWLDLRYVYPQESDGWTKTGFCSFGIGHFFYLAAVSATMEFSGKALLIFGKALLIAIAVGAGAALLVRFGEKPMGLHYGKFRGISVMYAAVLFFTAAFTLASAILCRDLGLLVMGGGLVLFAASDLILSRTYFAPNCMGAAYVISNHALYYAGQYLIALSPLWLGKGF